MRNNLWIGSGISGMGEIPILGRPVKGLTALIRKIFTGGVQGFAYDPNDLTTLYQDATGTIPVTAAGQPVGLMLDKSKGLVLGTNAVLNGDFSQGGTGWVFYGGVTFSGGKAVYDGLDNPSITQYVQNNELGAFYKVRFTISNCVKDGLAVRIGSGAFNFGFNQNKTYEVILPAIGSSGLQFASAGSGAVLELSDISVKKLSGNHAYQTVSASRPILQQTPILGDELVVNGDFSNGLDGWDSTLTTTTVENGRAKVTYADGGGLFRDIPVTVGKTYKVSSKVENISGNPAALYTYGSAGFSPILAGSSDNTPELYVTAVTSSIRVYLYKSGAGEAYWDDVSFKEVTGYLTDQNYLKFDGVDDSLQTNNIDFTATDKMSLFVGVRKNSGYVQVLCELSSNMNFNDRSFYLTAPEFETGQYGFKARANAPADPSMTAITQNTSTDDICVLSASSDLSADRNTIRRNGLLSAISYDLGTGNFGNHPFYIGRRDSSILPFNGHLYSLIGIGRLTTDSETAVLEKAIAKNTGVTLNA